MILFAAAVAETAIIVFTPRIQIADSGILDLDPRYTGDFASVVDVRSVAVYGIGALIVAALCYWATSPAFNTDRELRADLASARLQIESLRADLDAVTENLTEPEPRVGGSE